jgi:phospholipid/cholesterol/gamma-HCH transport system substrate-binding protein
MLNQTKNMLIGLFVVLACGLIIGMILFVEPSIGDNKQVLYIRFSNINGINMGTRVTFAGKPIGEIVAINTIPNARNQPTDELGQLYYYQLTAHIDSHIKVYTTDSISIQTTGLLGERSVVIMPKYPPLGTQAKLATIQTPLYGNSVDTIESAFYEIGNLSDKVSEVIDNVNGWINENGVAIGDAVRSFDRAMDEMGSTLASVNQKDIVGDLQSTLSSFTSTSESLNQAITVLNETNTFDNAAQMVDQLKTSSSYLQNILQDIDTGKGTIGKLINYDDFYLKLMNIFSKVNTTMNDINHYGILFNMNKQWQKSREKRANLLSALKTPQEFKEYFETEIDQINMAMTRLSILIEKAEQTPEKQQILKSSLFKKDFADLLKRSIELTDSIKMYNEQLNQPSPSQGCCP